VFIIEFVVIDPIDRSMVVVCAGNQVCAGHCWIFIGRDETKLAIVLGLASRVLSLGIHQRVGVHFAGAVLGVVFSVRVF
jgi:hypothetical protein